MPPYYVKHSQGETTADTIVQLERLLSTNLRGEHVSVIHLKPSGIEAVHYFSVTQGGTIKMSNGDQRVVTLEQLQKLL